MAAENIAGPIALGIFRRGYSISKKYRYNARPSPNDPLRLAGDAAK
ncbi:MAG: hypothetical protein JSS16_11100 [Proteobacteria bacterium]|nr:hypothetical protein [Pseudomonadota bacterium]